MMRRSMTAGLMVGLLAWGAGGATLAQDEMIRVVDYQRIEVPIAGISVGLPVGWIVETPSEVVGFKLPPEYVDQGPTYWRRVIHADSRGPRKCYVDWYQDNPMPFEAHAREMADHYADIDPDVVVEVSPVELPLGEGFRTDSYRPAGGSYGISYFFESGPDRYRLQCFDDNRPDDDYYLSIVETVELLEARPAVLIERSAPGFRRALLPMTDLAVSYPEDWRIEPTFERSELEIPAYLFDGPTISAWTVLRAHSESGSGCEVRYFRRMPLTVEEHGALLAKHSLDPEGGRTVATEPVALPVGEAMRVDADSAEDGYFRKYIVDAGDFRLQLTCASWERPEDAFRAIAETIEIVSDELFEPRPSDEPAPVPPPEQGFTRVLVPQTGLAVSFPEDWIVETMSQPSEFEIPSNFGDGQPVTTWTVLSARSEGGSWCLVTRYEDVPMSVMDHAMWMAMKHSDPQAGYGATSTEVELPVGGARRVDLLWPESGTSNSYLLDASGERVQLMCNDPVHPPQDDFLSIAQTIVVTGAEPEIASADFVSGFSSVVEVGDGRLMRADCELALWAEYEDGTFREWLSCWLSSEPVDDPADQGTWPGELVSISGDACEWVSDYWAVTDGSETWAEAYELSVTPEGRVFGSSTYGPEVLDCTDE